MDEGGTAPARRGVFITFEGADGVGKSTQIRKLAEALRRAGAAVVETREPGGAPSAELIRDLLVRGPVDRWTPLSEALLMNAARAEHLEETIRPALARGDVVLSDRFADSTMAYQGVAGTLGEAAIRTLQDLVVRDDWPDLTLVLHSKSARGLASAKARAEETVRGETRFEDRGDAYQEAVAEAFLEIARSAPERCILIDADQPIEAVHRDVLAAVSARFAPRFDL